MKKLIGLLLLLALPLGGQASDPLRMKIDSVWDGARSVHPIAIADHWDVDTTYWMETEHGYIEVIPKDRLFPVITETTGDSIAVDSVLWTNGKDTLLIRSAPKAIPDTIDSWWEKTELDEIWHQVVFDSLVIDSLANELIYK